MSNHTYDMADYGNDMAERYEHWSPDPSHAADELTEWEVPNTDYTGSIPPIPGTYDPREDDPTPRSDAAEWIDAMFDDPLVQLDTLVAKYTRAK